MLIERHIHAPVSTQPAIQNVLYRVVTTMVTRRLLEHEIAEYDILALTPDVIIAYRDERLKEVSAATVRREIDLPSQVIGTAIKDWRIPISVTPVTQLRRPAPAKARARRLHGQEETTLRTRPSVMATHAFRSNALLHTLQNTTPGEAGDTFMTGPALT